MSRVVERAAETPHRGPVAEAVAVRERLMALTEDSYTAALRPTDPGGISCAERAALAERIARHCRSDVLIAHYVELRAGEEETLADPAAPGDSPRSAAMASYVDKVTLRPREAVPEDIAALRAAGLEEADIVRLAGLVGFVNYQIRLVHVLVLMGKGA